MKLFKLFFTFSPQQCCGLCSWVSLVATVAVSWWLNWTRWQLLWCWMTTHSRVRRWNWEELTKARQRHTGSGTGNMTTTRGVHTPRYSSH